MYTREDSSTEIMLAQSAEEKKIATEAMLYGDHFQRFGFRIY